MSIAMFVVSIIMILCFVFALIFDGDNQNVISTFAAIAIVLALALGVLAIKGTKMISKDNNVYLIYSKGRLLFEGTLDNYREEYYLFRDESLFEFFSKQKYQVIKAD